LDEETLDEVPFEGEVVVAGVGCSGRVEAGGGMCDADETDDDVFVVVVVVVDLRSCFLSKVQSIEEAGDSFNEPDTEADTGVVGGLVRKETLIECSLLLLPDVSLVLSFNMSICLPLSGDEVSE
jgi:hypothetical protein